MEQLFKRGNVASVRLQIMIFFLDDSLLNYKYPERWQSEIQDRTFFDYGGLKLNYL